jgi:hypothetical protein
MKVYIVFLIGVFYFVMIVLGLVLLGTAQFRSSSGSDFDKWRQNYDSNILNTDYDKQKLDDLRKALGKDNDALNWVSRYRVSIERSCGLILCLYPRAGMRL